VFYITNSRKIFIFYLGANKCYYNLQNLIRGECRVIDEPNDQIFLLEVSVDLSISRMIKYFIFLKITHDVVSSYLLLIF